MLLPRFQRLSIVVAHVAEYRTLPYSGDAEAFYRTFPARLKRIGSSDCRTTALALRHNLTVVTRNRAHFEQVPGLAVEDWTK